MLLVCFYNYIHHDIVTAKHDLEDNITDVNYATEILTDHTENNIVPQESKS